MEWDEDFGMMMRSLSLHAKLAPGENDYHEGWSSVSNEWVFLYRQIRYQLSSPILDFTNNNKNAF